jgi:SOS-response transcriptional repressor LexA
VLYKSPSVNKFFKRNKQHKNTMNQIYAPDQTTEVNLPLYMTSIEAGFPSPADDYIEGALDLNQHLIKHIAWPVRS